MNTLGINVITIFRYSIKALVNEYEEEYKYKDLDIIHIIPIASIMITTSLTKLPSILSFNLCTLILSNLIRIFINRYLKRKCCSDIIKNRELKDSNTVNRLRISEKYIEKNLGFIPKDINGKEIDSPIYYQENVIEIRETYGINHLEEREMCSSFYKKMEHELKVNIFTFIRYLSAKDNKYNLIHLTKDEKTIYHFKSMDVYAHENYLFPDNSRVKRNLGLKYLINLSLILSHIASVSVFAIRNK